MADSIEGTYAAPQHPLFEVGFGLAPKDSMPARRKSMRVPGMPSANGKGSGTWAAMAYEPYRVEHGQDRDPCPRALIENP